MKQLLLPEAVKKSVREALVMASDCDASVSRIRGFLSNLPAEGLHYKTAMTKNGKAYIRFFMYRERREIYLKKDSLMLYRLCRKRYLMLLLKAHELKRELLNPYLFPKRISHTAQREFDKTVTSLLKLLDIFVDGNLDIARIVLTSKQYRWFTGNYSKKTIKPDPGTPTEFNPMTDSGVHVRSKSERDIGNMYEEFAVPYHYEEMLVLDVAGIVTKFENMLTSQGAKKPICYMKGNSCYWNVPPFFQYLNMPGSIWRAYKPNSGKIYIYNDFHVMLADGEMIAHEHEGTVEDFDYRSNASERIYVMRLTNAVSSENLITTMEIDVKDFRTVIRKRILPRLWF